MNSTISMRRELWRDDSIMRDSIEKISAPDVEIRSDTFPSVRLRERAEVQQTAPNHARRLAGWLRNSALMRTRSEGQVLSNTDNIPFAANSWLSRLTRPSSAAATVMTARRRSVTSNSNEAYSGGADSWRNSQYSRRRSSLSTSATVRRTSVFSNEQEVSGSSRQTGGTDAELLLALETCMYDILLDSSIHSWTNHPAVISNQDYAITKKVRTCTRPVPPLFQATCTCNHHQS